MGKLSTQDVDTIIELIQDGLLFQDIADQFNVSLASISGINQGYNHRRGGLSYPLSERVTPVDVELVCHLLATTDLSVSEIATQADTAYNTVLLINRGGINRDPVKQYPIRKLKNTFHRALDQETLEQVRYDLLYTSKSKGQIALDYGIVPATVFRINQGVDFPDDNLNFPLRKESCHGK